MTTPPLPADPEPGPASPESILSDRAGDVLGLQEGASVQAPASTPLVHVLTMLDAVAGEAGVREGPGPARRREILRVATRLFAERGYRGTSLRDISGEVGISHPGMLHHFHSKEALLDAVLDELEAHAQHMIDHLEAVEGGGAQLEAIVRRDFSVDRERMVLFAVLSTEAISPQMPARLRVIRLRRVYERIAEHVLSFHERSGQLLDGVDIEWAARTMVSMTIALATREATIGRVQPSAANKASEDYIRLMRMLQG